jgi:hypothetical protein
MVKDLKAHLKISLRSVVWANLEVIGSGHNVGDYPSKTKIPGLFQLKCFCIVGHYGHGHIICRKKMFFPTYLTLQKTTFCGWEKGKET